MKTSLWTKNYFARRKRLVCGTEIVLKLALLLPTNFRKTAAAFRNLQTGSEKAYTVP